MYDVAKSLIATTTALTLVACASSPTSTIVHMPASELPIVAPNTLTNSPPPTNVTTIQGSVFTLHGPIGKVELKMKEKTVPITLPFKARIEGTELEVLTDQVRTYHVPDISYASVETLSEPRKVLVSPGRRNAGTVLIVLSIPGLLFGTVGILSDIGCSSGGGLNFCGLDAAIGGALFLVGAGLFIPGVYLTSTASQVPQPKLPPSKITFVRPQLRISPTGAVFAAEF
jgi:hypothetical protein